MSQPTSQQLEAYVPVYDTVPEKWEQAREFLVEHLKKISNAVNAREIGWLLQEELLSGQQFFPGTSTDSQQFRSVLKKVVNFGVLPNAGVKAVPHGITTSARTSIVQLYAAATDPTSRSYIPIPYVDPNSLANGIALLMDATNVIITTAGNYNNYTTTYVVIFYIQEL